MGRVSDDWSPGSVLGDEGDCCAEAGRITRVNAKRRRAIGFLPIVLGFAVKTALSCIILTDAAVAEQNPAPG